MSRCDIGRLSDDDACGNEARFHAQHVYGDPSNPLGELALCEHHAREALVFWGAPVEVYDEKWEPCSVNDDGEVVSS